MAQGLGEGSGVGYKTLTQIDEVGSRVSNGGQGGKATSSQAISMHVSLHVIDIFKCKI